jgi:hypothetical protein
MRTEADISMYFRETYLMRKHICYFISGVVALTLILTGCSGLSTVKSQSPSASAATLAKYEDALARYNQIKTDMGYAAVVKIMGKPGELINTPDDSGHSRPPNYYRWALDTDDHRIDVGFVDINGGIRSRLFSFGIAYILPGTNARTTAAKFNQVKVGMTYDKVVSILGSPGLLWSSSLISNSGSEIYGWWPEGKPENSLSLMMNIGFGNGLVLTITNGN